jgi:hypothetical protein
MNIIKGELAEIFYLFDKELARAAEHPSSFCIKNGVLFALIPGMSIGAPANLMLLETIVKSFRLMESALPKSVDMIGPLIRHYAFEVERLIEIERILG